MNQQTSESEFVEEEERDDAIVGVAFRWSLLVIAVLGVGGAGFGYWWTRPKPLPPVVKEPVTLPTVRERPRVEPPKLPFTDITAAAGIDFQHENGAAGEKLLPETMGGGCALLDFDGDRDQDILFVNSRRWPHDQRPPASQPATLRLYRNDGAGKFIDATAEAGLALSWYGMGVACGDYDNDGDVDLFITCVGPNHLLRNDGGKFVEVTAEAGVGGTANQWSSAAGWFDCDNDRDLDLFVCNYVQWTREFDLAQEFQLTGGTRAYGRPQEFPGAFPYLYRNDGAGKFTDISAEAGLQVKNPDTGVPLPKSLGLTFADFDHDGWLDVVIANDTVQNLMFRNRKQGKFEEVGAVAGVAFDNDGNARGAMGIDVAYFRNNEDLGIAIGNFANEMTALYVSRNHELQFTDEAVSNGLGPSSRLELKFGVAFADFDLDSRLDFVAANGHLEDEINKVQPSQHYEQPPHLYWNCGPEQESEFLMLNEEQCGADFLRPLVGRGIALADLDGDGDLDVLITGSGQKPRLLRNDQRLNHHWLRLKLVGKQCNHDAIGSWVEVHLGDKVLRRQVMPTRSYLSQSELPVTFGLGTADKIDRVLIRWADGSRQQVDDLAVDQFQVIEQATELSTKPSPEASSPIQLRDVSEQTGIAFQHHDGSSGQRYVVETVASGMATFDYDGDGRIDIYFVNGGALPGTQLAAPPRNRLYRNLGDFRFIDVTEAAGVGDTGHGLGVTVGDFNNDGHPDLYVSNVGQNVLYENRGEGTFREVSQSSGTSVADDSRVGAGVCFLDRDADGDLDLFVANYLRWQPGQVEKHIWRGQAIYPGPERFPPCPSVLLDNNGDGSFTDVSESSRVGSHPGFGMGVVSADFDQDGDTDVFVGNDGGPGNFLFRNNGGGVFEEVGIASGVAYSGSGLAHGSMGVDCGDVDNDGLFDLYVTSYQGQLATLYRNRGQGSFEDVTQRVGAGLGSFNQVTWGCGIVDLDNDGRRDIFYVCGHLIDNIDALDDTTSYLAAPVVLWQTAGGRFTNVSAAAGTGLQKRSVGRGACLDDFDNDGDLDVAILNSRREPTVLRNESPNARHWLQLLLVGTHGNRDAVGAVVTVHAGGTRQVAEVRRGRGFQSHFGTRLHFGLGEVDRVERIEVRWLGGGAQVLESVSADKVIQVLEDGDAVERIAARGGPAQGK